MPISASDAERRGHAVMGRMHHPWCQELPPILTKLKQQQKWAKKSPLLHGNGGSPFVCMSAITAAETCLLNVPKAFEVGIPANKGCGFPPPHNFMLLPGCKQSPYILQMKPRGQQQKKENLIV